MTKAKKERKKVHKMRGLWKVMVIQIATLRPAVAHPFRALGTLGALGPLLIGLSVASPFRGWGPGEGYGNAGAR